MLSVTEAQLRAAAPAGDPRVIKAIADQSGVVFAKYGLANRSRVLGFLSTALEETGGFRALTENLNYSAEQASKVWPSRFPTVASAVPFAKNPRGLANRVYGFRSDLGNTEADDGWRFRGQGLIQITGRANFTALAKKTGLPLIDQPELVTDPAHLLECSCAQFVEYKGILDYCDAGNWMAVWALIGTGRATGKVINLVNHNDALSRLQKAIPALVDGPAQPPVPSAPTLLPDVPGRLPAPVSVHSSMLSRLWHWLTGKAA